MVITGRKVFLTTAAAFGIIIAVNVTMAVQAVRTFPGLEVKNSYVASQSFDHDRAAQQALGWAATAAVEDGVLTLALADAAGPVLPASVTARLGRATERKDDVIPDLTAEGAAFTAPVTLAPGYWVLWVEAAAQDGTAFRQRLEIYVE